MNEHQFIFVKKKTYGYFWFVKT